jgi:uncharacterized protein (TIGR03382 family)
MRRTLFALPCALAYLFASGCTSCGGVALKDMPAQSAQTICGKTYECCTQTEIPEGSSFGPDQATCGTNVQGYWQVKATTFKDEEQRGRLVYHPDRMAECLERWRTVACHELKSEATSNFPACDAYVQPKVPVGQSCRINESCINGHCQGATAEADGICRAYVPEGSSCASAPCGQGLYCESSSKQCRRMKSDGMSCNSNGECATGGCNGRNADGGTTPGLCGLKGGEGTVCFVTSGCSATGGGPLVAGCLLLLAAALLRARRPR